MRVRDRAGSRRPLLIVSGLVLLAIAVLWLVMQRSNAGVEATASDVAARATSGATTAPVDAFVDFVNAPSATATPAGDAAYIADGLRWLAGALLSLDLAGAELNTDLRAGAAHVLLDPDSIPNAALVRGYLHAAADAVAAASPADRALLTARADAIEPTLALTAQTPAVRQFFQACADVLATSVSSDRPNGSGEPRE
jgi:hypothetical protein